MMTAALLPVRKMPGRDSNKLHSWCLIQRDKGRWWGWPLRVTTKGTTWQQDAEKHGRPTVQACVASPERGAAPVNSRLPLTLNTDKGFLLQSPQIHILLRLLGFWNGQEQNDNHRSPSTCFLDWNIWEGILSYLIEPILPSILDEHSRPSITISCRHSTGPENSSSKSKRGEFLWGIRAHLFLWNRITL